jgi:YesN/AraC family two-component response regulator
MRKKKDLLKWAKFTAKFIKVELDLWELEHPSFFRRRPESSLLSQALAFIDQQYTKDISLGNLAHLLKVNPNYLSGVIHSGAGKTFRRLLNEKRVKEAEIYLKLHREMNVTEIAMLCGFNDSNYFSTVFKKITGISPVKFRLGAKCA